MNGTVGYWIRVIVGALDDGLIAAGTVLLGGSDPAALAGGTISLQLSKTKFALAGLLGAWVMFKNIRAYLKVPDVPPKPPQPASGA